MNVMICRIYLTECEKKLEGIVSYLKQEAAVRGVTVFRAIEGFGESGVMHSANFLDLKSDLPLVVEFFDETATMRPIIEELKQQFEPGRLVFWSATTHE